MKTIPTLDPTAIFCCNDLMATGAIRACKRLGLSVPEDISVIGFDNITLSKLVEPQIATMDQNMFQLGSNAAAVLVEMMHGGQSKRITLENILIARIDRPLQNTRMMKSLMLSKAQAAEGIFM